MKTTTTTRDRELFRRATNNERCIVCGSVVVVYDWNEAEGMMTSEIANPNVCHVNLGHEVASYWCPRMRS